MLSGTERREESRATRSRSDRSAAALDVAGLSAGRRWVVHRDAPGSVGAGLELRGCGRRADTDRGCKMRFLERLRFALVNGLLGLRPAGRFLGC